MGSCLNCRSEVAWRSNESEHDPEIYQIFKEIHLKRPTILADAVREWASRRVSIARTVASQPVRGMRRQRRAHTDWRRRPVMIEFSGIFYRLVTEFDSKRANLNRHVESQQHAPRRRECRRRLLCASRCHGRSSSRPRRVRLGRVSRRRAERVDRLPLRSVYEPYMLQFEHTCSSSQQTRVCILEGVGWRCFFFFVPGRNEHGELHRGHKLNLPRPVAVAPPAPGAPQQ